MLTWSMPQLGLLMLIILRALQMLSGGMEAAREYAGTDANHHAGRTRSRIFCPWCRPVCIEMPVLLLYDQRFRH